MSDDDDLWRQFTKDIKPLEKEAPFPPQSGKTREEAPKIQKKQRPKEAEAGPAKPPDKRSTELDRRTAERLSRGKLQIEGRLDLHGMRRNEAFDALSFFIEEAYRQGKRMVLVITGKGRENIDSAENLLSPGSGILKQEVPRWLSGPPLGDIVLKTVRARREHGGDGALYVYVRRKR